MTGVARLTGMAALLAALTLGIAPVAMADGVQAPPDQLDAVDADDTDAVRGIDAAHVDGSDHDEDDPGGDAVGAVDVGDEGVAGVDEGGQSPNDGTPPPAPVGEVAPPSVGDVAENERPMEELDEPGEGLGGADERVTTVAAVVGAAAAVSTATPGAAPRDDPSEGASVEAGGVQGDGTHDDGGHDDGTHDDGTHDDGAHDDGTHDDGGHDDGTHDDGGHDDGTHDDGGHDDGGHDDGTHDDGTHGGQPDRLTCTDIDPDWAQLALTGHPVSGTYTLEDGFRSVELTVRDAPPGGKLVDWAADGPIDAMILRSGQDAATYEYEPAASSDTGLVPPLQDRDGRNLASVLVCYDTTDAVVGLDVVLADSEDPVVVGDGFDYLVSASTSAPLADAVVVLTLPREVELVEAPGCTVEGDVVRCGVPLDEQASSRTRIAVTAVSVGDAIARAELRATAGGEDVVVRSSEVTRVIGAPGGGCGGHDDGGHDDGCGGATEPLVEGCLAIDPDGVPLVLRGPFASREYVLEGPDGVVVTVTVEESTGSQAASWVSNVPVDAVLARTGRDVATFSYDPPALAGAGVVGPAGGSGAPRPMADLAVCYVPRRAVDVGIAASGPATVPVGRTITLDVTVSNAGWVDAERVTLGVWSTAHLSPVAPGTGTEQVGTVAAGTRTNHTIELLAVSPGVAEVVLQVAADDEDPGAETDDQVTIEVLVVAARQLPRPSATEEPVTPVAPVTLVTPVAAPTPVAAASTTRTVPVGELARTGAAGVPMLVIVGVSLLLTGTGVVRRGATPR